MLFLDPEFLAWQGEFELLEYKGLRMPVFLQQGLAWSPLKAPFGGIQNPEDLTPENLPGLLRETDRWMKASRAARLQITLAPDAYLGEKAPFIHQTFARHGYRLLWQDLNYTLSTAAPFASGLRPSGRWKLNRLVREGFCVQEEPGADWEQIFPLFRISRERKGYTLSMSRQELAETTARFPERYRLWTVGRGGERVAAGLCIRVSPAIDYLFYTADTLTYRKWSPVVLLHQGIAGDAAARGVGMLDLGTASLKGAINAGVANFKRNLGAHAGWKLTWLRLA